MSESGVSICPRCGRKFQNQYPRTAEEVMDEHTRSCSDIDEEFRGEID